MKPVTLFGPDFPFDYDKWIKHPAGLGVLPEAVHGAKIGIIGAGAAGVIAGYELMKLGAHPVLFEAGTLFLSTPTSEGLLSIVSKCEKF